MENTATIEVKTSYIWVSFFQALCCPIIEIDGIVHRSIWGDNSFSVSSGSHLLKAYHRWYFFEEAYSSSITVSVSEGQNLRLRWHTGWSILFPGKWSVLDSVSSCSS